MRRVPKNPSVSSKDGSAGSNAERTGHSASNKMAGALSGYIAAISSTTSEKCGDLNLRSALVPSTSGKVSLPKAQDPAFRAVDCLGEIMCYGTLRDPQFGDIVKFGDVDFDEAVEAVLTILHEVAARNEEDPAGSITYMQLSERLRIDYGIDVPYHSGPLPYILGEASKREDDDGRGMISSLVVEQDTWRPSSGFFRIARQAPFNRRGDDIELWLTESRRVRREHELS